MNCDAARHGGREADAIVGAVDVVVHRLRDRDDTGRPPRACAGRRTACRRRRSGSSTSIPWLSSTRRTCSVTSTVPSPDLGSARNAGTSSGFTLAGFIRDVCRNVPPLRSTVRTWLAPSGSKLSLERGGIVGVCRTSPCQPRRMPTISWLSSCANMTAALMHALRPGTSPPPVRIPIFTRLDASRRRRIGPSRSCNKRRRRRRYRGLEMGRRATPLPWANVALLAAPGAAARHRPRRPARHEPPLRGAVLAARDRCVRDRRPCSSRRGRSCSMRSVAGPGSTRRASCSLVMIVLLLAVLVTGVVWIGAGPIYRRRHQPRELARLPRAGAPRDPHVARRRPSLDRPRPGRARPPGLPADGGRRRRGRRALAGRAHGPGAPRDTRQPEALHRLL